MRERVFRIALTMRVTHPREYHEPRDSISQAWIERLLSWGHVPVLVPNLGDRSPNYVADLKPDVLILTGGEDVGKEPLRDKTELSLLNWAVETGIPTLGVCRGLQLANLEFGGSLIDVDNHVAQDHEILFQPPWSQLYGQTCTVNSYHALGISSETLAPSLMACAFDQNGLVEAARSRESAFAAVMWHPERGASNEGDRRLLEYLAAKGPVTS